MSKANVQPWAIGVTLALLAAAAIGYFAVPFQMFAIVGIEGTAETAFLARTLAAAFLAMLPMAWTVRKRSDTPRERAILFGLAIYMFASSGVDLHAFGLQLVGPAALPSIAFRVALGGVLLWLAGPPRRAA